MRMDPPWMHNEIRKLKYAKEKEYIKKQRELTAHSCGLNIEKLEIK